LNVIARRAGRWFLTHRRCSHQLLQIRDDLFQSGAGGKDANRAGFFQLGHVLLRDRPADDQQHVLRAGIAQSVGGLTEHGDRSVMVASAVASEGKTLTATNLALTLSHSYERRVLLIDADLRRPSVHDVFQLPNRVGLSNSLRQPEGGRLPVQHVMPRLWILPAGRPDPDPMSSLVSDTMKQLLVDAAEQFDWIIVDTPPVALLPDANLLAGMIDTALLVVSANTTPFPLVKRATEAIGAARILGVVFNRAQKSALADGYGYYGYNYKRDEEPQERQRRSGFNLFAKTRA